MPGKSRPDGTTLPVRVGGCLAPHWRRWQAIEAESWVVTILRNGYHVPFLDSPPSPFSHPGIVSDVPGRLSSGSSHAARGRGDACQRSLRNRPRSGSLLLQLSFPGGEGLRWLETRDRSLTPERVRPADFIQDGNSRFCTVFCQRGGFSSFPGSERHVPSDPNPSIFKEAIVFRTGYCSPGLHQGLRGRVRVGTLPRDQTSPLSGRLVGSLLIGMES